MLRQESEQNVSPELRGVFPAVSHEASGIAETTTDMIDAQTSALLENAVARVCNPLARTQSPSDLLEQRTALRAELDTLVLAHKELEEVHERAIADAISHFQRLHTLDSTAIASIGPVSTSSSQLHARTISVNVEQTFREANRAARPATFMTLGILVPFYLLHMNGLPNFVLNRFPSLGEANLYKIELLLVPFLVGLLVDSVIKRHAVRGALLGIGFLAIYALLWPSFVIGLAYCELWPFGGPGHGPIMDSIVPNAIPGLCGIVLWPLMATLGAKTSARLRQGSTALNGEK